MAMEQRPVILTEAKIFPLLESACQTAAFGRNGSSRRKAGIPWDPSLRFRMTVLRFRFHSGRPDCLPRRPAHGASAKHMQMQMIDGLAAIPSGVDHHATAVGRVLFADLGGTMQQVTQYRGIIVFDLRQ